MIIQIGSNVGTVSNDPIWGQIMDSSNKSILIEPNPFIFDELKENYKANKDNIIFENIAISTEDGTQTFYYYEYFDGGSSQHSSLDRKMIEHHQAYVKRAFNEHVDILEVDVPTMTLDSFFDKHKLRNKPIDILAIDAEGYDAIILLSSNFEDMDIKTIIFEHLHCGDKLQEVLTHLGNKSYKVKKRDSENYYLER